MILSLPHILVETGREGGSLMTSAIRKADENDVDSIVEFVKRTGTATDHIDRNPDGLFMMEDTQRQIVATATIEYHGVDGLLRTLVIDSSRCGSDDVLHFFSSLLTHAERQEMATLYMVTASSGLFTAFGFRELSHKDVPVHVIKDSLLQHSQKREAVVMAKTFNKC
jgi:N-acetylglutamate synthase-like GNAT family acetyltransferase